MSDEDVAGGGLPGLTADEPPRDETARSPRRIVLVVVAAVALLLPVSIITAQVGDDPRRAGSPWTGVAAEPDSPTPSEATVEPTSPTGSPSGSPPAAAGPGGDGGGEAAPAPSPTQPPLAVGIRLGLEPAGAPGFRVRHRDFVGRIDRIGPGSGATDRADSAFTVRAGLSNPRCLSFEAVNVPGFFLRHQNFVILLHRDDGSALFAADATFCAEPGPGQQVSFRSVNFPDRFLGYRGNRLVIEPVGHRSRARTAATFTVRAPL